MNTKRDSRTPGGEGGDESVGGFLDGLSSTDSLSRFVGDSLSSVKTSAAATAQWLSDSALLTASSLAAGAQSALGMDQCALYTAKSQSAENLSTEDRVAISVCLLNSIKSDIDERVTYWIKRGGPKALMSSEGFFQAWKTARTAHENVKRSWSSAGESGVVSAAAAMDAYLQAFRMGFVSPEAALGFSARVRDIASNMVDAAQVRAVDRRLLPLVHGYMTDEQRSQMSNMQRIRLEYDVRLQWNDVDSVFVEEDERRNNEFKSRLFFGGLGGLTVWLFVVLFRYSSKPPEWYSDLKPVWIAFFKSGDTSGHTLAEIEECVSKMAAFHNYTNDQQFIFRYTAKMAHARSQLRAGITHFSRTGETGVFSFRQLAAEVRVLHDSASSPEYKAALQSVQRRLAGAEKAASDASVRRLHPTRDAAAAISPSGTLDHSRSLLSVLFVSFLTD